MKVKVAPETVTVRPELALKAALLLSVCWICVATVVALAAVVASSTTSTPPTLIVVVFDPVKVGMVPAMSMVCTSPEFEPATVREVVGLINTEPN